VHQQALGGQHWCYVNVWLSFQSVLKVSGEIYSCGLLELQKYKRVLSSVLETENDYKCT